MWQGFKLDVRQSALPWATGAGNTKMSKANQKFVQADEAVSPVIGVILMVAITVVLAAVVFVLVSNLSKGGQKAPDVSFSTDETRDRITLVTAASGLNWDDFKIKATVPTGETVNYVLNVDGSTADTDLSSVYSQLASAAFTAGDFLDFCGTTTVDGTTTIQLLHTESNTVVYETQFNGIVAC